MMTYRPSRCEVMNIRIVRPCWRVDEGGGSHSQINWSGDRTVCRHWLQEKLYWWGMQQLCKCCRTFIAAACCSCNNFKLYCKFYCMFYFTCDRCFKAGLNVVLVRRRPKCQTLAICMPMNDRCLRYCVNIKHRQNQIWCSFLLLSKWKLWSAERWLVSYAKAVILDVCLHPASNLGRNRTSTSGIWMYLANFWA